MDKERKCDRCGMALKNTEGFVIQIPEHNIDKKRLLCKICLNKLYAFMMDWRPDVNRERPKDYKE